MRRVLPAFILALLIHVMLFLWVDGEWAGRNITPPRTRIITMTLFQREAPAPAVSLKKNPPKLKSKLKPRLKKATSRPKIEKAVLPPPFKKKEILYHPDPEPAPLKVEKHSETSPSQSRADDQQKDERTQAEPEITAPATRLLARGDDRANVRAVIEAIPLYQVNPPPVYPVRARRRGHIGTVTLEVLVNSEGRVNGLRIFRSSGHSSLDRSALRSVKEWIFEPGKKGMKNVEMWVRVPVRFQLE